MCVFSARTSRRKRRGHPGAVLSRARGLVGRASLNRAGRRESHPDRLSDLRQPRASAPARGSGASHGPRPCRGEGVGSVTARLTGSHWVFAATHPSLSHLPSRPATKGSRLGPCLPLATLQRCSGIQYSGVPRLEAGPEVSFTLQKPRPSLSSRGPGSFPGGFRACSGLPLPVAAAIVISRPLSGQNWDSRTFSAIFTVVEHRQNAPAWGFPGGSGVRSPPSEAGDTVRPESAHRWRRHGCPQALPSEGRVQDGLWASVASQAQPGRRVPLRPARPLDRHAQALEPRGPTALRKLQRDPCRTWARGGALQ